MKQLIKIAPLMILLSSCSNPTEEVRLKIKKINENIVVEKREDIKRPVTQKEIYQAQSYRSPFEVPANLAKAQAQAQELLDKKNQASLPQLPTQGQLAPLPKKVYHPDAITVDTKRTLDYLESFTLSNLKMTGVVGNGRTWLALIQTPEGDIVMAKVGDYIGENFGRIMQINKSSIVVKQAVKVDDVYLPKTVVVPVSSAKSSSQHTGKSSQATNSQSASLQDRTANTPAANTTTQQTPTP